MERLVGTISRGIRAPIIREGDDIAQIVADSVLNASRSDCFALRDRDVVAVTEAVVARAQGNYATIDDVASDVKSKFGEETVGVIFPILSRNRFAICLKGFARGLKKIVLMLTYPSDEVGNHLIDLDLLDEKGINPYSDVLDEKRYRELFGYTTHRFTGVDYVSYYKDLITAEGCEVEIVFANDARVILNYTNSVINCDIHTRHRTKREIECFIDRRSHNIDDYEEHIRTLTAECTPRKLYNELCSKFRLYVSERRYNKILRVYNQKSMLPNCGIVQLCGFANKDKYLKYILSVLREDSNEATALRQAMREVVGVV